MPKLLIGSLILLASIGAAASMLTARPPVPILLNVSYDPTRELFKEINTRFTDSYLRETGQRVEVRMSHGGSGSQALAVINGLYADVVNLALGWDIDTIARYGLVRPGWQQRLPHNGAPYTSTIVFLVRQGNPRHIRDWPDLLQPGLQVITPNPKTSGGARWNFLAAWGQATQRGKSPDEAKAFLAALFRQVPVLDTGARSAAGTFLKKGIGDVLLAWENEALLALKKQEGAVAEIVMPPATIRCEPPVALVDANVDFRKTRKEAEAYARFLYRPEAQEIMARHGYRPQDPEVMERFASTFPAPEILFSVEETAGSWEVAYREFFADGALFDQIFRR